MTIEELEAYEIRKARRVRNLGCLFVLVLGLIAFILIKVVFADPPHLKAGSFNIGIEQRINTVLAEREDLGYLVSLEMMDNWDGGYRVKAKTSRFDLVVYFLPDWTLKTIRYQQTLAQAYP